MHVARTRMQDSPTNEENMIELASIMRVKFFNRKRKNARERNCGGKVISLDKGNGNLINMQHCSENEDGRTREREII